jgi:hypothetical protein
MTAQVYLRLLPIKFYRINFWQSAFGHVIYSTQNSDPDGWPWASLAKCNCLDKEHLYFLSFLFAKMDSKLATRTEILADNSMSVVFERNRLKDMGYVYTLELFYSSHG